MMYVIIITVVNFSVVWFTLWFTAFSSAAKSRGKQGQISWKN